MSVKHILLVTFACVMAMCLASACSLKDDAAVEICADVFFVVFHKLSPSILCIYIKIFFRACKQFSLQFDVAQLSRCLLSSDALSRRVSRVSVDDPLSFRVRSVDADVEQLDLHRVVRRKLVDLVYEIL